jgi:simple sugar transport system substrate-binding protein
LTLTGRDVIANNRDRQLGGSEEEESVSDQDAGHEVVERLEWAERHEDETPHSRWRKATRRTALTGAGAGIAALILEACGGGGGGGTTAQGQSGGGGVFGNQKKFRFTLVNHVTTNPFFVPTKYGAEDACKLLGCTYQWTGSQSSNVNEMVNAMNSAITSHVDGIGVALVDQKAFNSPTERALNSKIPVVSYNADATGNARLAYIGQDLFLSGQEMGKHIVDLVPSGDVALFIATPGSLNIQPRIDGAKDSIKKSGKPITTHTIATGAAVPRELSVIDSYWTGHKNTKGMFAVDAGSTQGVAQVMKKYGLNAKGVKAGGYDLLGPTTALLAQNHMDFTIDQQPYLQGFFPIMQLYLYQASGGLTGVGDMNTGLKFLDPASAKTYNTTKSRFEGTSTSAGVSKS